MFLRKQKHIMASAHQQELKPDWTNVQEVPSFTIPTARSMTLLVSDRDGVEVSCNHPSSLTALINSPGLSE
jgi:hypothetical protein